MDEHFSELHEFPVMVGSFSHYLPAAKSHIRFASLRRKEGYRAGAFRLVYEALLGDSNQVLRSWRMPSEPYSMGVNTRVRAMGQDLAVEFTFYQESRIVNTSSSSCLPYAGTRELSPIPAHVGKVATDWSFLCAGIASGHGVSSSVRS